MHGLTAVQGANAAARGASDADVGRAAGSTALSLVGSVTAAMSGFALTVVIGRGLGASGAGLFFEAFAVFTILSGVATFGADTALVYTATRSTVVRRVTELRAVLAIAFGPVITITCLLAAAAYIAAPQLGSLLLHDAQGVEGTDYIRLLAPFLVPAVIAVIAAQASRGFGGLRTYVGLQQVLLPVGRLVLVAIALAVGLRGLAIPLAWALPLVIVCPVAVVALLRGMRSAERASAAESLPRRPLRAIGRELWSYAFGRGFAAAFTITIVWLDVLLVGAMRSTAEAGVYAAASRFITSGALAMQAMRLAMQPQIGRALARNEHGRAEDLYRVSTQWIVASSWPIYLVLATLGPVVLRLFGHSFTGGANALAVLSLAMLVNLATGNVNTVLLMAGRSRWNAVNTAVALVINIVLNLILIPHFGIVGAAIAWSASIIVDNLAGLFEVRVLLGLRSYGSGFLVAAAMAVVCYGIPGLVLRLFDSSSLPPFFAYLVIASAAYVLILYRLRRVLRLDVVIAAVCLRRTRNLRLERSDLGRG